MNSASTVLQEEVPADEADEADDAEPMESGDDDAEKSLDDIIDAYAE